MLLPPGATEWPHHPPPDTRSGKPQTLSQNYRLGAKCTFTKSARAGIIAALNLISDVLRFGRLWYDRSDHAIGYATHSSGSADAVIRVYDSAGNVIETHEHECDFKEW